MTSPLPKNYRQRLTPCAFKGGELHEAVMKLIASYGYIHKLEFPGLNWHPILYQYIRDLALPSKWLDLYARE